MPLLTTGRRLLLCVATAIAVVVGMAAPASASAVSGTAHCGDIYSSSQTQKVNVCVYFEWAGYINGYPYKYHVYGSMASYRSAGSSRLTIRTLRVQKKDYTRGWYDTNTTNPSYPVRGTYSVHERMYNLSRTQKAENYCPPIRAVMGYRIDFTNGTYKQGNLYGPAWSGSCLT